MKRKLTSIALAVLLLVCMLLSGCAKETQPFTYQDAKNGVVRIYYRLKTASGQVITAKRGSGFFVGKEGENPEYLITNHHVVKDYLGFGSGEWIPLKLEDGSSVTSKAYLEVYFEEDDYVEAYVVAYNENADVAILRLDSPTDQRISLKLRKPTNDMVGTTVYGIGFPGLSDNLTYDAVSQSGINDMSVTSGTISRLLTSSGSGTRRIQTDMTIQHGNSGGPMVNGAGEVVGINSWGVTVNDEHDDYACDISEAILLLNQNGIPFTLAEDEAPVSNLTLYIGIAVAVAVAILLAVITVIVLKKKKAAKPAPAPYAPPANPEDSGFRLQCTGGALSGRRTMIRKRDTIVIGRNPSECNIIYPNTPGISGKHCAVWCEGGKILLKDLGSSHGTFVQPGIRLAANQTMELHVGDSFYLGSPQECFVVAEKRGS